MKCSLKMLVAVLMLAGTGWSSRAAVLLDDTWADGTRTDTSLPAESAWYASSASSLTAAAGAMTGITSTSSRSWWTYFTTNPASPVQLAVGETLKLTLAFTPSGVNANNGSFSFRLGLYDFSGGSRTTTDGNSPNATGVTGYLLSMNFGQTFGVNNPIQIRERTVVSSSELMGTSTDYTTLAAGGGLSGDSGFSNGVPYTLVFSITRNATSVEITTTFTNTAGWSISQTASDTSGFTSQFDALALRPSKASETASTFVFSELKVELLSSGAVAPVITSQPYGQTVIAGQNVSFGVEAEGSLPLAYQWFFNTNTPLADATNALRTITNAQSANAGAYSVRVTNTAGSVTSDFVTLIVNQPVAPTITTNPLSQVVSAGLNAAFAVIADGTAPMSYQWYFNTNTPLANATNATLVLTNVQPANEGSYSVIVTNIAGSATSSVATLMVDTTPVAPSFTLQPVSLNALVGGNASFTALAAGTAEIGYQWRKDGADLAGATLTTLNLTSIQSSNAGNYVCVATNSVGSATSAVATLTVSIALPDSAFNLMGFAQAATGGGMIPESDPKYRKVYNADDFVAALDDDTLKVIEIMNDLNLGWNEIPVSARTGAFRANATPSLHPALIASGVTLIDIQDKNGLTIFSANGATVRHAEFNVKRCNNVLIRNLKFDELWEWDEATKGDYDSKDWDFMTIDMASNGIWVDHCDFTKAYDGVVDIRGGSHNVTISWCRFLGDDGGTNSFVRQQINFLEQSPSSYTMYNFLRTRGFSVEDIIAIIRSQKKGHLVGATEFSYANANLSVTLHHNYYFNFQDRIPRLRGGNSHDFNLYVNNTQALAAKRLRNSRVAAMSPSDALKLSNGTYKFDVTLNGAISTEDGAVLVEKCHIVDTLYPIRNNQTDPNDPSYTGKIRALDTIYNLDATSFHGGSEDPGSPLAPVPAPPKPFSYNGFTTLPYAYTVDDPTQLAGLLTGSGRIGTGELTWAKTNWLRTSYPATAPVITGQPESQLVNAGQNATFTVTASGATLSYQWYFNTNTPLADATNSSLTLANVQLVNAGKYSVVVSNSAGTAASSYATLTVNRPPVAGECAAATGQNVPVLIPTSKLLSVASDPDGDGLSIPGATALSTNSGVVTLANGVIQYTPPGGYVGSDRLSYTLADSRGGTGTGHVVLVVVASNSITLDLEGQPSLTLGLFHASFAGVPNLTYTVDRATNVSGPWELGYTNLTAGTNGLFELIAPHNPGEPMRFYRTRYP